MLKWGSSLPGIHFSFACCVYFSHLHGAWWWFIVGVIKRLIIRCVHMRRQFENMNCFSITWYAQECTDKVKWHGIDFGRIRSSSKLIHFICTWNCKHTNHCTLLLFGCIKLVYWEKNILGCCFYIYLLASSCQQRAIWIHGNTAYSRLVCLNYICQLYCIGVINL